MSGRSIALLLAVLLASACADSGEPWHPFVEPEPDPPPPPDVNPFVGNEACRDCHPDRWHEFIGSAHAEQYKEIRDGRAPSYVHGASMANPVSQPPPGTSWEEISFVLGGVNEDALFVDHDGFVITGQQARWDMRNGVWLSYKPGEIQPFDCGPCHMTGYDAASDSNEVDGLVGSWEFEGVGCEACHGPGRAHADSELTEDIEIRSTSEFCYSCHANFHGPHFDDVQPLGHPDVGCMECHNPHASPRYDYDRAILKECADCHVPFEP